MCYKEQAKYMTDRPKLININHARIFERGDNTGRLIPAQFPLHLCFIFWEFSHFSNSNIFCHLLIRRLNRQRSLTLQWTCAGTGLSGSLNIVWWCWVPNPDIEGLQLTVPMRDVGRCKLGRRRWFSWSCCGLWMGRNRLSAISTLVLLKTQHLENYYQRHKLDSKNTRTYCFKYPVPCIYFILSTLVILSKPGKFLSRVQN